MQENENNETMILPILNVSFCEKGSNFAFNSTLFIALSFLATLWKTVFTLQNSITVLHNLKYCFPNGSDTWSKFKDIKDSHRICLLDTDNALVKVIECYICIYPLYFIHCFASPEMIRFVCLINIWLKLISVLFYTPFVSLLVLYNYF